MHTHNAFAFAAPDLPPVYDGPSQWAHTRAARLRALGRRRAAMAFLPAKP